MNFFVNLRLSDQDPLKLEIVNQKSLLGIALVGGHFWWLSQPILIRGKHQNIWGVVGRRNMNSVFIGWVCVPISCLGTLQLWISWACIFLNGPFCGLLLDLINIGPTITVIKASWSIKMEYQARTIDSDLIIAIMLSYFILGVLTLLLKLE